MAQSFQTVERQARRAYEWARLRRAALGVTPVVLVVLAAVLWAARPVPAVALGLALVAVGVGSLWFGNGLQRSLAPGVLAGLVPLIAVNCVTRLGHVCAGGACMSVCLPACALGGAAVGFVIGVWAARRTARAGMWATASAAALLTGAMGCACVGASGVVALALGFAVSAPVLGVVGRFGGAKA